MGAAPKEAYVDVSRDHLEKFKTTQLLLIHGLADGLLSLKKNHSQFSDNVHYQNSAVFAEALQNNQVDFDFLVS